MMRKKVKQLLSHIESFRAAHFTVTRSAALFIVLPACFVVVIYFISILSEVVNNIKTLEVVNYENSLATLKKDLPFNSPVDFISRQKEANRNFYIVRYILIPARVVRHRNPRQNYLIVETADGAKMTSFQDYTLEKDYGDGFLLFKRNR